VGDLNAYAKGRPESMFRDAGGYTDLVQQFGSELAYSFVFDGQLGNRRAPARARSVRRSP
jgi:predicted extracellular nuclease